MLKVVSLVTVVVEDEEDFPGSETRMMPNLPRFCGGSQSNHPWEHAGTPSNIDRLITQFLHRQSQQSIHRRKEECMEADSRLSVAALMPNDVRHASYRATSAGAGGKSKPDICL
jgi:hypothetical protein